MVAQCGYALEETGADASSQNGMTERPNRTFGNMMRCLLKSAELGPEFWSYALLHSVYLKNRLYHSAIKSTPYQKMTGVKPNLSNLRIFGCKLYARKTGRRRNKLDHHTTSGIFLGFSGTQKIAKYLDEQSGIVKHATHVTYE